MRDGATGNTSGSEPEIPGSNPGPAAMKKKNEILYEEVFRALNKAKIDYAVCGGLAVILYGYSRLTGDLDLTVNLERKNLEKLYDVLIGLGYKSRIPIGKNQFADKENLEKLAKEKNMKVVSFYNLEDPFKIIDIRVNLPKNQEILKRKKYDKIDDFDIPVISIDDLIKMKEDLARPRDLIDVENLKKIKKGK